MWGFFLAASFVLALMQVGILNPDLLCDPIPHLHLPGSEPSNATSGHYTFELLENYGHLVPLALLHQLVWQTFHFETGSWKIYDILWSTNIALEVYGTGDTILSKRKVDPSLKEPYIKF